MKNNFLYYILIVYIIPIINFAQSPGGISDPNLEIEYWLRADQVSNDMPFDGASVTFWKDQSGKNRNFINANDNSPSFVENAMNFHSALDFNPQSGVSSANNQRRKLISNNVFTPDPTRSYYVILVSELGSGSSSYSSVFSLNRYNVSSSNSNNSFGWTPAGVLWERIDGTNNTSSSSDKNFGIGIYVLPNSSATGDNPEMYINGLINSPDITPRELGLTAGVSVIGNSIGTTYTTDYFYGKVMEIIVMSKTGTGIKLTTNEIKQINSALAIKYGITLNVAQTDYVLSNGNSIYNSAEIDYTDYKYNIIGIARDDASGVFQKQSVSTINSSNFGTASHGPTIYLGDLKDTNRENTDTSLQNLSALMIGSNNLSGISETPYTQPPLQGFQNTSLTSDQQMNHISNEKFRARVTTPTSTIEINLNPNSNIVWDWVLVSSTEDFIPGSTSIYPIINNKASDITIENGDYIAYGAFHDLPAGVTNARVEYWLRADQVSNSAIFDEELVTSWADRSPYARNFYSVAGTEPPRYLKSSKNFHSAVDFYYDEENPTNKNLQSENVFSVENGRTYYVIHVSTLDKAHSTSYAAIANLTSTLDNDNGRFGWRGQGSNMGQLYSTTNDSDFSTSGAPNKGYGIAIHQISGASSSSGNNTKSITFDAQIFNASNNRMAPIANDVTVLGGEDPNSTGSSYRFFGELNEFIVLSTPTSDQLDIDELQKINTYLALKYGITLNATAQPKYILSNGTEIYNTSTAGLYTHNIFGLVRDDTSILNQKQAKSSDGDSPVVFLGNLAENNEENTDTSMADLSAIIFASNGSNGTDPYNHPTGTVFNNHTLVGIEKMNQRTKNIWTARTTGPTNFTVNMDIGNAWDWVLVSNNETFDESSTRIYKTTNGVANSILINNGDFIAYGRYNPSPAGINATIEYWLRADNVTSALPEDGDLVNYWADQSEYGRNFFLADYHFAPKFMKSSMNYHSAVDFYYDDSNRRAKNLITKDNVFPIIAGRTYYIIQVSKLDETNSSSYADIANLQSNNYSSNARFGWRSSGLLYSDTNGSVATATSNLNKGYGIGIYKANTTSGTNSKQMFNDAKLVYSSTNYIRDREASGSVLGSRDYNSYSTTNSFFGELNEFIVFSKDSTDQLTDEDLEKINSYLAIKYGLTLDNGSQTSYILSDATVVYNSSHADYLLYNKDIFGIARDDEGNLLQKQSTSSDNPILTVFVGNLAETNNLNLDNSLLNKEALMFGGNGLTGLDNYIYNVDTQFANYKLDTIYDPNTGTESIERLSNIFKYKLRAKTTGKTSFTVNMSPGLGEWVLVSNDLDFTPSDTRIYKVKDGIAENVVVNEKDYIAFAFFRKAPAGVNDGLVLWLNASERETLNLNSANEVLNWTDFSGFGTMFSKIVADSTPPLYVECDETMNFQPSINFRKTKEYLSTRKGPFSVSAPDDYSFISAFNIRFNTDPRMYFTSYGKLTRSYYPALGVKKASSAATFGDARIYDGNGANAVEGTQPLFKAGATTILGHTMKKSTYFQFHADGSKETITRSNAGIRSQLNGPGTLGIGGASNNRNMLGLMGEHIAYESELSDNDRDKIDGYLGLKYAITIRKNSPPSNINFNYKFSNDNPIWTGNDAIHSNYHNNIASLVRDDLSDLHNRQARSTDLGAIVHMGIGEKLGCNPILDDIIHDYTSLTWGHNGVAVSPNAVEENDFSACGNLNYRLKDRIWLVDNKNFTQEVLLTAGGVNFPYRSAIYQVYLLVADDPAKFAAENWDQIIPMTYNDNSHQVNYNFTEEFTYFTFGAVRTESCGTCDFEGYKNLEFSTTNWLKGEMGPKQFNLGDDFHARVSVEDPSNQMALKYPRSASYKSLRERRRGGDPITTKIQFLNSEEEQLSASTSFEIFHIDRHGPKVDSVKVIGLCAGAVVYPNLSYAYNRPERSRYLIDTADPSKATGKTRGQPYNGSSGYTSLRTRLLVEFDNPVEEIQVIYKSNSTSASRIDIGIGQMTFYCPAPLPPPNEDGLILTKQAPTNALLCEQVEYTFRVYNTNCLDDKTVTFNDVLPSGMIWVKDSFLASDLDISGATITGYETNELTVSNLVIPADATPLTLKAKAVFTDSAIGDIEYRNQAKITDLISNEDLLSTDRVTGEPETITFVTDSTIPGPVEISASTNTSCFKMDDTTEIEITVNINNPNGEITDNTLFLGFDHESFTFIEGSIQTSNSLSLPAPLVHDVVGGENVYYELEFDEFDLPSGAHWIKYKVSPSSDPNHYEINPTTMFPIDAVFTYEITSNNADPCLASSTNDSSGEFELQFCNYCVKAPTTGTTTPSSVGITSFKDQIANWPENVPNGHLVLESGKRGMVLTRTTTSAITTPTKGMIIYDTDDRCIKIYNGSIWNCIERKCNE